MLYLAQLQPAADVCSAAHLHSAPHWQPSVLAPALAHEQELLVLHLQASATHLHWSASQAQDDPQHSGLPMVEKDKLGKVVKKGRKRKAMEEKLPL
ncbi:hypothetical protein BCR43DRAFT_493975 [Syncephalastrum racemosum]|uniref:Uncharacterized protein n=1 Tax=Syncephalastrum racemosum TaxID=13706 RepID=A0A1X2H793_SYNRA|nr:hypothetical protein BCR43DRAFT_493975 [Syncephalastrum racemosum]